MAKDKFHDQYPNYELIPEKTSWVSKVGIPALAIGGFVGAIVVTVLLLHELGKVEVPIPSIAGINQHSMVTALNMAHVQIEAGQLNEAAANFRRYFDWGGQDPKAMTSYSKVLNVLGHQKEAAQWQERAAKVKSLDSARD